MCTPESLRRIDTATAGETDAFEQRLLGTLNESALALMLSIGHRCGLLATMVDGKWRDCDDLADEAGLNARYVREWLGAMTSAGVVELDHDERRYRLPAGYANLLSDSGEANLAVYAQLVPQLALVEDDILECFHNGGGVDYSRYTRFHDFMAEDSSQTVLAALFDHILPLVPGLADRLEAGIRVLDAGCGRGLALMRLAAHFPASRFTGYDLSGDAIEWANHEARSRGLDNVRFEARDLSDFDETAPETAFDLVTTFDAIHDQAWPLRVLSGIRRSLAPDGVYLAQDIRASGSHADDRDHPLGTFLYAVSTMHCMTVSLAQGGEGLGTMWGREKALEYMRRAGFGHVEVHELAHDIQNDYYVCRVA